MDQPLPSRGGPAPDRSAEDGALGLIVELTRALEHGHIRYCHWKSNEAIDRSASGENDLDLLVARADAGRFGEVLLRLGFKAARPARSREVPGLIDHYGLDLTSGRLVHLQAHYQLVLGDDMTKNFRLPIEQEYLDTTPPGPLIRMPAPEFELALFVVRMILKHASWDAQLCRFGSLSSSEERELAYLFRKVPGPDRAALVAERLPFLPVDLVERCLRSLEMQDARRARASVARTLERTLMPLARRPRSIDIPLRTVRRVLRGANHVLGKRAKKSLVAGGALVAVTGDDGRTTSSVVDDLVGWLGSAFVVQRFAFGEQVSSSARRTVYARARRHTTNGGIAICDQFGCIPVRGGADGGENIDAADVLVALEPNPEPGRRSGSSGAVDGSQPFDVLMLEVRSIVWAGL